MLLEREVIFTEDVRNILGERPFETEEGVNAEQPSTEPVEQEESVASDEAAVDTHMNEPEK